MRRLSSKIARIIQTPKFAFPTSLKCQSTNQLTNTLNPVTLANLKHMEQLVLASNVGLQYFNFLLDCFAETRLLQEQPDLTLFDAVLRRLADPATYKGQTYTPQEISNLSYRLTRSKKYIKFIINQGFLRLTMCPNQKVLEMVDGSYPIFTRFSQYLLENANLI